MKTKLPLLQFKRACNKLQSASKSLTTLLLFSTLLFSSKTFAQIGTGTVPVQIPSGGFAIDGNLKANTSVGDWLQGTGAGGFVLDGTAAGNPLNASTTFHLTDLYNSGMDDNFKAGLEVHDNPNSWKWVRNPVNAKEDINNALVHFSKDANGHLWVMVAADRLSTNGNAYIDFEFLQNKLSINSNGTFTSAGPDGGRTAGDFILTLQLTNGGTAPKFFVERWQSSGGGFDYVEGSFPAGSTFAAVNTSSVPVTYDAFGGNSYATNAFAEAAVDLTALIGSFDKCNVLGIKSLLVKTKESQSSTATIVDFVGPPLPVDITIGVADAGKDQAICSEGATTKFTLTGTATPPSGATVTSTVWSFAEGEGSGTINDPQSLSTDVTIDGTSAKLVLTVVTDPANCNPAVTDTVLLTATGNPQVFNLTPGNYCAGEVTQGTITLGGSQSGVSYQLYDAANNTVQAAKVGTGDALIWTEIPAGTYYIKASTGSTCSSTTDNTTVSENPVPDDAKANVTQPTCTKATGTITVTAPIGTGLTYSINGTDYQSNPTFNDVASGVYTIYVMNSTGCISTSGVTVNPAPTSLSTPTVTAEGPGCGQTTGTVTVTDPVAGITYTLTKGTTVLTAVNGVFSAVAPGTYTFTASNGTCSANGTDVVVDEAPVVPGLPTASDQPRCGPGTVELTASGCDGGNITWYVHNTSFERVGSGTSFTTPSLTGTTSFYVTCQKGICEGAPLEVKAIINDIPTASISGGTFCKTSTTQLSVLSGPTDGTFSSTNGLSISSGGLINLATSTPGTYTVTYNFSNGTCSNSTTSSVTVNDLPTVGAGSDVAICNGKSTTLTATGATSYLWTPADGLNATTGASVIASPTITTTYTVTGTDANTCSNTASVKVTVNPVPSCTISNTSNPGSNIAGVGMAVGYSGPTAPSGSTYTYSWSITNNTSGATFSGGVATATTKTVTVTTTGTGSYTLSLKVTDNAYTTNCNATCTYPVTVNTSNAYYTVTQGFYGNTGGKVCTPSGTFYTSGSKGNESGLIALSIKNIPGQKLQLGIIPVTVATGNKTFIMGYSTAEVNNLINYLPATQTATVITANSGTNNNTNIGGNVLNIPNNLPKLNNGKISDVLLGQAITLALNVYIPGNNLGNFVLKTGYLTTQKADPSTCPATKVLACSKDASAISSLQLTTNAGLKVWMNGKKVTDLLNLASNALGGANIATLTGQSGITLSDINNAVDVINRSFDGGRLFLGYYSSAQSCSVSSTLTASTMLKASTTTSALAVKAYPNPYGNVINFTVVSPVSGKGILEVYDLLGKKLGVVYEGQLEAGVLRDIKYHVPAGARTTMVYRLTVGGKTGTGILIPGDK